MATVNTHTVGMAKLTDGKTALPVRLLREQRGLTREGLAHRAGVSTSTVTRMELDAHLPSGSALISIANALEVTLDDLVGRAAANEAAGAAL